MILICQEFLPCLREINSSSFFTLYYRAIIFSKPLDNTRKLYCFIFISTVCLFTECLHKKSALPKKGSAVIFIDDESFLDIGLLFD